LSKLDEGLPSHLSENNEGKTARPQRRIINVPWNTIALKWCPKSRKLSKKVKELISSNELKDWHTPYLLKYPHSTQNKLADAMAPFGEVGVVIVLDQSGV